MSCVTSDSIDWRPAPSVSPYEDGTSFFYYAIAYLFMPSNGSMSFVYYGDLTDELSPRFEISMRTSGVASDKNDLSNHRSTWWKLFDQWTYRTGTSCRKGSSSILCGRAERTIAIRNRMFKNKEMGPSLSLSLVERWSSRLLVHTCVCTRRESSFSCVLDHQRTFHVE
jgi:hypothetical protein